MIILNKFKTLRQGFSCNVGFITLLTWYKFNLFCLYDINNKQFHRNEANHMWRCFRKHNREYTKQRSICIYFNVKSHVYYKGKVYCLYIKSKFTVLCSLQLTLPAPQYPPQSGKKLIKTIKSTGAEAGLWRGFQPCSPYPGCHMLPRASFVLTIPLLLTKGCICSWWVQVRTKAWSNALDSRNARIWL